VGGLFALGTGDDFKGDLLAFLQRFEAFDLDGGKVCEEIFTAFIGSDEAEALGVIEPFNDTACYFI
jgi:hypothetical protein